MQDSSSTFTPPTAPVTPDTSDPRPYFPVVAIVIIVVAVCVVVLAAVFILLKCLQYCGLLRCSLPDCVGTPDCSYCCGCCYNLAHKLDCELPQVTTCLDVVCPTREQCVGWCDGCHQWCQMHCRLPSLAVLCDGCAPLKCFSCKCKLRMPECRNISCLCFECGTQLS